MATVYLTNRQIQIITTALNSSITNLLETEGSVPDYKLIGELKALEHHLIKEAIKPETSTQT